LSYPTSDPSQSLNIIDFAFLNKIVYQANGSLQEELGHWLSNWTLVKSVRREVRANCSTAAECQDNDWTTWFVFEGRNGTGLENTTVVTIRGTKTILEMLFDMDLWSMDILGLNDFAGRFAGVGGVIRGFWQSKGFGAWYYKWKRKRYASVMNHVKERLTKEPKRIFYISGHSLGGGLAQIIAAQVAAEVPTRKISAVTFSAPGVRETMTKLGLNPDDVQGLSVNVIPKKDPVPTGCGSQAGITFEIDCLADGLMCHRPFNTVCELMKECGDSQSPKRVLPCSFCPLQAKAFYNSDSAPACQNVTSTSGPTHNPPWDPRPYSPPDHNQSAEPHFTV
jgi:hypothetical protein